MSSSIESGVVAGGRVELALGPLGEPHQCGGATSLEVVGRLGELEGAVRVGDGRVDVAADQRESRSVDGHLRRQAGEVRIVEHDRFGDVDIGIEPALDVVEQLRHAGDLAADHERADLQDAQHRTV